MLRSVLYGVDKIPDKWFDKVPGGYYKAKAVSKKEDADAQEHQKDERRKRRNEKHRNEHYDDGYRSEGGRGRHRRNRSSYDGGADDYHTSGDDNRRPRRAKSHKRHRSVDDHRYGYDDGYEEAPHDRRQADDRRPSERPRDPDYDQRRRSMAAGERPPSSFNAGPYVDTDAAAGGASAAKPPHPQTPRSGSIQSPQMPQPEPQSRGGSMSNTYVPYAHIYGQPSSQSPRQSSSAATPPVDTSSRPNSANQTSPQQGYQQNPDAQQAPTAAAAGAGAAYNGQPNFIPRDPRYSGYDPRNDPALSPREKSGYDDNDAQHSESPRPYHRPPRREYPPEDDSYDPRADNGRSRSERRPDDRRPKPKDQSKSKSESRDRQRSPYRRRLA